MGMLLARLKFRFTPHRAVAHRTPGLWMALVVMSLIGSGCASKETGYHGVDEVNEDSRQHPSSYFIDRFNVEKEMPKNPRSNVPFYFKKCEEAGAGFPSRTSYECDYPF